jgi:hypothetical protein
MAGKDPAFLFYSNDFLSGTFTMSDDQVGKYIRLLCIQHQKGILTAKDMLNICKTYDEDIYCKFHKDNEGNYHNIRLKEEYEKRKAYSESRRKNRKGVVNKKSSKTYVKHMEDVNENEDKNKSKKEIKYPFDSEKFSYAWNLWKEYKKKEHGFKYKSEISEQAALNNLAKIAWGHENICYEIIKQSIVNGYKGLFEVKATKQNNDSAMNDYKQQILNNINNA